MMITDPNVARLQVADRTRRLEAQADRHRTRRQARHDLGLPNRTVRSSLGAIRARLARRSEGASGTTSTSAPVSAARPRPVAGTRAC